MLPAERLGRILGALLVEGRPRTIRGAACKKTVGRRPVLDGPVRDRPPLWRRWTDGSDGADGPIGVSPQECQTAVRYLPTRRSPVSDAWSVAVSCPRRTASPAAWCCSTASPCAASRRCAAATSPPTTGAPPSASAAKPCCWPHRWTSWPATSRPGARPTRPPSASRSPSRAGSSGCSPGAAPVGRSATRACGGDSPRSASRSAAPGTAPCSSSPRRPTIDPGRPARPHPRGRRPVA